MLQTRFVLRRALPLVALSTACGRIGYEVLDDSASAGPSSAGAPSSRSTGGSQLVGAGGEVLVERGGGEGGQTTASGGSLSGGSGGRAGGSTQEQGGMAGVISGAGASSTGPSGGWVGAGGSIMAGGAPVAGGTGAEGGAPVATGGHSGGADPVGAAGAGGLPGSAGVAGSGESGGSPATAGAGPGGTSSGGTGASAGAAGASSLGDCRTDTYGGNEYLFCASEVAWSEASDGCASVGMHLVRVDSAEENQWLFDSIYDTGASARGIWIGASDQIVEGEWRWTDGTLFWLGDSNGSPQGGLFNAWYASHPSRSANADCAAIDSNNGSTSWYATGCGMLAVFVCES